MQLLTMSGSLWSYCGHLRCRISTLMKCDAVVARLDLVIVSRGLVEQTCRVKNHTLEHCILPPLDFSSDYRPTETIDDISSYPRMGHHHARSDQHHKAYHRHNHTSTCMPVEMSAVAFCMCFCASEEALVAGGLVGAGSRGVRCALRAAV